MGMTQKEQYALMKLYETQAELASAVKKYEVATHADLDKIDPIIRRGMIHAVADIFELTIPLSDSVKNKLALNNDITKQFRNIVAHRYGTMTNPIAFACIQHCIDKSLMETVKTLSAQTL
jgi:hypothetical protein